MKQLSPRAARAARAMSALALVLAVLGLGACNRHQDNEGVRNLLGAATPGLVASGSLIAYVDMDTIVRAHPLNAQLRALEGQIIVLRQESVSVPTGMTTAQSSAYNAMQRDLEAAQVKFEQDLAARRSYYERQEAQAMSQVQGAVLGAPTSDTGGVLGGLQQQYGDQAKQLQKQAFETLQTYRNSLYKQDADHLKHVQQLVAENARAKIRQRSSELSTAETRLQIDLARRDQSQRLNLQTKLQNLTLSDKERADYNAQLQNMSAREDAQINALKARDTAALNAFEKAQQAEAAAKFDAERKATQTATQARLAARQREVQAAMGPQMQALGGKFQQQLQDVNKKLATDPKFQARAQNIHSQMQSKFLADAKAADADYRETRKALIARYSAIARMQFQDNQAIAAQIEKLAADRRDLYTKIVDQIRLQISAVAKRDGIATVFASIRGGGVAINLTDQVTKALNPASPNGPQPQATTSRAL
ncbi:MAG: hypothetical protein ACR2KS_01765 [Candidatus Eremiobacter antarcticus]|nr:hypothetical protein [Candidatus Eremiobacteraeota bacterium]MBC5808168.1 hypothetical protein [Candidatus Eremiobacteraeota bacterium]